MFTRNPTAPISTTSQSNRPGAVPRTTGAPVPPMTPSAGADRKKIIGKVVPPASTSMSTSKPASVSTSSVGAPREEDVSVGFLASKRASIRESIITRSVSNDLNKNPFGASKTHTARVPFSVPVHGASAVSGKPRCSTLLHTPSNSGNSTRTTSSSTTHSDDVIYRTTSLRSQKTGHNDSTRQKSLMDELKLKLNPYVVRSPSAVKAFTVQRMHTQVLTEFKTKLAKRDGNDDSNSSVFLACAKRQSLLNPSDSAALASVSAKKGPVWGN